MAALVGMQNGTTVELFDKSGTIASATLPQLIIPVSKRRTSFIIENLSSAPMYIEFGGARATATLTSQAVTSCTITNAGFNYTYPPTVVFFGGGEYHNPTFLGATMPDYPAPQHIASAHCVMTGTAGNLSVASIVIDNPGSFYVTPPYVYLRNNPNDPNGCANPFYNSTPSGFILTSQGSSITADGNICPTDQCAIYCGTATSAFTAKFTQ